MPASPRPRIRPRIHRRRSALDPVYHRGLVHSAHRVGAPAPAMFDVGTQPDARRVDFETGYGRRSFAGTSERDQEIRAFSAQHHVDASGRTCGRLRVRSRPVRSRTARGARSTCRGRRRCGPSTEWKPLSVATWSRSREQSRGSPIPWPRARPVHVHRVLDGRRVRRPRPERANSDAKP